MIPVSNIRGEHSLGEIQHYDLNIPAMEESKGGKGDGERLTKCQISL